VVVLFHPIDLNPGHRFRGEVFAQQTETGILRVQVLDPNGTPIAGAHVSIYDNEEKRIGAEQTTNPQGEADLAGLPGGVYRLQVEAEKYETFSDENIGVQAGTISRFSIQMAE